MGLPHPANRRQEALGFTLLGLSVLCNGAAYHLSKAAMVHCSAATFTALAAVVAGVGFLALGGVWRAAGWNVGHLESITPRGLGRCLADCGGWLLLPPAAGALGAWLANATVKQYGPEIAAFLANQTFVFLLLAGVCTGERLTRREGVTIAVIILGAFLFSFRDRAPQWAAIGLMAVSCLFTATKQFAVKRLADRGGLPQVMTAVIFLLAGWALAIGVVSRSLAVPSARAAAFTVAASLTGSVAGMLLLYAGYQQVGVARGAPVDALRPVVVLVLGLALGTAHPGALQYAGGALVVAASAVLGLRRQARAPGWRGSGPD